MEIKRRIPTYSIPGIVYIFADETTDVNMSLADLLREVPDVPEAVVTADVEAVVPGPVPSSEPFGIPDRQNASTPGDARHQGAAEAVLLAPTPGNTQGLTRRWSLDDGISTARRKAAPQYTRASLPYLNTHALHVWENLQEKLACDLIPKVNTNVDNVGDSEDPFRPTALLNDIATYAASRDTATISTLLFTTSATSAFSPPARRRPVKQLLPSVPSTASVI